MLERKYEIMYVLHPDLPQEKRSDLITRFQQIVIQNGGTIVQLQEIGKRRLAYEVAGVQEGYYVLMQYSGSTFLAGELERALRISEAVLRFLTVRTG